MENLTFNQTRIDHKQKQSVGTKNAQNRQPSCDTKNPKHKRKCLCLTACMSSKKKTKNRKKKNENLIKLNREKNINLTFIGVIHLFCAFEEPVI
jgi:hypothetical protein